MRVANFARKKLMRPTVIIDNGHGCDTPGKCSPDRKHREWQWARRCARAIARKLERNGIAPHILVPETHDVPLRERCARANRLALASPGAVLLSIHNTAAGSDGRWHSASGWSAFVSHNASVASCRLATILTEEAASRKLLGNRCTPPEGFWRADLAICRNTVCPAVLTENMFQDCPEDVAFLSTQEGFDAIVDLHVDALLKYFNKLCAVS